MALYTANVAQEVAPESGVVFTDTETPCPFGFVLHQNDTATFRIRGVSRNRWARYEVHFQGNVALAGTVVAPISVAIATEGETIPTSIATVTPAAVDTFTHIHTDSEVLVPVPCCSSISVRNIGTTPITIQNASIRIQKVGA